MRVRLPCDGREESTESGSGSLDVWRDGVNSSAIINSGANAGNEVSEAKKLQSRDERRQTGASGGSTK